MVLLFAAALVMPDGTDQGHDYYAGSRPHSPVVSSLTGENVPSSWVLNAAIISRNKRQNKARDADRNENAQTVTVTKWFGQTTSDIRR